MKQSVMRCKVVGHVIISFLSSGQVSDDVYKAWYKEISTTTVKRYIAASIGFVELTSVQRANIAELLKKKGMTVAAVSDEPLIRMRKAL